MLSSRSILSHNLTFHRWINMASIPGISILVCGRTGVGKSSLINYILGEDVCKVGDPTMYINAEKSRAFSPGTAAVEGFDGDMNGVRVTVYDSPGLQDGTYKDQQYVDEMYEKCRDVDLVLYCHDITESRWTGPEFKSIDLLTRKFGVAIWNKTILAFTKANRLKPAKHGVSEKEYLKAMAEVTEGKFQEELRKVVRDITGEYQHDGDFVFPPAVLAGSEREQVLPTGPFIGKMWLCCLKQLRLDKVNSFIKATNSISRITLQSDVKPAGSLMEYTPSMDDLTEAWKVMLGRRRQLSLASDDEEELQYLISLDKGRQEKLLEKLGDTLTAQGKASEGMHLMDSINELMQLIDIKDHSN